MREMSITHAMVTQYLKEGKDILGLPEGEPILREYGIALAKHRLAVSPEEAMEFAEEVGYPVALKAIAPTILHKTDAGCVRLHVRKEELLTCYENLVELARKVGGSGFQGILAQEYIDNAIEVMVGITIDPQYGPVIIYGTGGIFVELFGDTSYRSIPISAMDAESMLGETKGFRLLKGARGREPAYQKGVVDILLKVSALVEQNPEMHEMDLNPILVTSKRAVVVDCRISLARPGSQGGTTGRLFSKAKRENLSKGIHARSVAVVGASRDPTKLGGAILKNIIEGGFKGNVYPVNRKANCVFGKKCYSTVLEIKGDVDLAVIAIPSHFVVGVLDECGRKGVAGCIIVTGGFSEIGNHGKVLEQQVLETVENYEMRVLGPNCQGMTNCIEKICASWPLQQKCGSIGIISQSGTVAAKMQELCVKEEVGFSYSFSLGNRLDVDAAELLGFFSNDESTRVIGLYLEGPKNGRLLLSELRSSKKPIVVLKSGRTPKGQKAARFHASTLAGEDKVFEGILRQVKALKVDTIEELFASCKALALLGKLEKNEVMIITSSGGAGILATDYAEQRGLEVVELNRRTKNVLAKSLPPNCTISNPLDLTGDTPAERYMKATEIISRTTSIRTFMFIIGDPIQDTAQMILDGRESSGVEIIPVYLGGGEVEQAEMRKLRQSGIPTYIDPHKGIFAIYSMYFFRNCGGDLGKRS